MDMSGEHMEGRLTGYDFTTPKGQYDISDYSYDARYDRINPTKQELIDYIGVLEDYIGDTHEGVWEHLDLKHKVWKMNK